MIGHTSVAPMRGWVPLCWDISIKSEAFLIPWKAASNTLSGLPTNVTTVLFVSLPGSTSKTVTP